MPGEISLAQVQYYAHPRNRFWPLMAGMCGFDPGLAYEKRLTALQACGVGLWDVLARCRRQGSLDAAIERGSEEVVPLASLLPGLPSLQLIVCNGATAGRLFERHLLPAVRAQRPSLPIAILPSTSPANAAFSLVDLQQRWQVVAEVLERTGNAATAHKKA